jgi:tellurite resistance protein TerC
MPAFIWVAFNGLIFLLLAFDLGLLNRKTHEIKVKEALGWSAFWIGLALAFNLFLLFWKGPDTALSFFTGYLIEKSLSVDNIFVFLVIFSSMKIRSKFQHKILYFGILGAMILRATFIFAGVALLEKFHWAIYLLGGILIITGIKMLFRKEESYSPKNSIIFQYLTRWIPVKQNYVGNRFFIHEQGRWIATPLLIALLLVETADIVFAIDSIPAILSVTPDPFIVYTSNIFAILGLRSLYFAFSGASVHLKYLHYGLAMILNFVGLKMIFENIYPISTLTSLVVIASILVITTVASLISKD